MDVCFLKSKTFYYLITMHLIKSENNIVDTILLSNKTHSKFKLSLIVTKNAL